MVHCQLVHNLIRDDVNIVHVVCCELIRSPIREICNIPYVVLNGLLNELIVCVGRSRELLWHPLPWQQDIT